MSLSGGRLAKVVAGKVGKKIVFCDLTLFGQRFPLHIVVTLGTSRN